MRKFNFSVLSSIYQYFSEVSPEELFHRLWSQSDLQELFWEGESSHAVTIRDGLLVDLWIFPSNYSSHI